MVKVVVIGAGYAGVTFAQTLEKLSPDTQITIIDKAPFFYHCVASLRAMVDENFVDKLFVPYENAFKKAKFLRAYAESIKKDNKIVVRTIDENNKQSNETTILDFDYLILATGSSYSSLIKYPDTPIVSLKDIKASLNDAREKIKAAKSVLIVGGGSVGCELAGEIACAYPNIKITLLDHHDKLISSQNLTDKFRKNLAQSLQALKVSVILGQKLDQKLEKHVFEKRSLKTDQGTIIESDIQFLCAGVKVMGLNLVQSFGDSVIENNRIKVNRSCQMNHAEIKNIFVIGDASTHPTPKMAYWGGEQAKFVAKSIRNLINGTCKVDSVPEYTAPTVEAIMIPLGPKGGVSQLPIFGGMVAGDFVTRNIKSADLFVSQFWKQLNAK